MPDKQVMLAFVIFAVIIIAVNALVTLFVIGSAVNATMQQAQQLTVDCSLEPSPWGITIKLDNAVYYCSIKERQDNKSLTVNPASGGDLNT